MLKSAMTWMYANLLRPDLYHGFAPWLCSFIESLNSPELRSQADEAALAKLDQFANYKYGHLLDEIMDDAKNRVITTGAIRPTFYHYVNPDQSTTSLSPMPISPVDIQSLLCQGKCFAFALAAPFTFFCTEIFHHEGELTIGHPVNDDHEWGILVQGSSWDGTFYQRVVNINKTRKELQFVNVYDVVGKDQDSEIPFGRFYHVRDELEFAEILEQMPTFTKSHRGQILSERQVLVNFATTLRALWIAGY